MKHVVLAAAIVLLALGRVVAQGPINLPPSSPSTAPPMPDPYSARSMLGAEQVFLELDEYVATRYYRLYGGTAAQRSKRSPSMMSDPWARAMLRASASLDSLETETLFAYALRLASSKPDRIVTWEALGSKRLAEGRVTAAEQAMREALHLSEKRLGTDHPDLSRSLWNLADVIEASSRFDEAEIHLQRAAMLCEKEFGKRDGRTGESYRRLGELREKQGRLADAESLYMRALAIQEDDWGGKSFKTLKAVDDCGRICMRLGKLSESATFYERNVAMLEGRSRQGRESSLNLARSLNNLGRVFTLQGRLEDAESSLARAYELLKPVVTSKDTQVALNNYAAALEQRGRKAYADSLRAKAEGDLMRSIVGP